MKSHQSSTANKGYSLGKGQLFVTIEGKEVPIGSCIDFRISFDGLDEYLKSLKKAGANGALFRNSFICK